MEITVDGRKVFAVTGGKPFDPSLPTVVFLHGTAMSHEVWALQTRYFAHHGRSVLALDLPGHGRTEGPVPDSIGAFADWVMRLLDAAGVTQAALVGHSMGGLIALEAAARHPDRVWALGLLGVVFPMKVHPDYLALAEASDHKAVELMNDWGFSRRAHIGGYLGSHRIAGMWLIGEGTRLVERTAPGVLGAALRVCQSYDGGAEAARKVRCPVLVLLGDNDLMTPIAATRAFARHFASARVQVLRDAGHMLMAERPDETLDALKDLV